MNMAWKEIVKNKVRFLILGSIIFLVSLLTFIISGLANGLSQDNASLIKDLPNGTFYMAEEVNNSFPLSRIDKPLLKEITEEHPEAVAFSIQMGFIHDESDQQQSIAFVAATDSSLFKQVNPGEIILDRSLTEKEIKIGDKLTNSQFAGTWGVKRFVDQKKYSHAPVAYISLEDYEAIYQTNTMQLVFIPGDDISQEYAGLHSFSKNDFLKSLPSYSAEQTSLNMIVWFLIVISGMLFAIFFYMMNVQKIDMYGILKAIGVKTSTLFQMMWTQMLVITCIALAISVMCSQLFAVLAPEGMPFHLTLSSVGKLAIIFVVIGLIGATLSGLQIKRIEPLQAIQQGGK
ncbi:ABC transporter permease [Ornithinibacillus californiensis]|uniref:ABC transporter permease n=1 Tax=Ornithinibacillus californiensis TaxID=161536 RepID=UPI00064E0B7F|nr:ABC transporter permease [Ornithinibacillus californiensis]